VPLFGTGSERGCWRDESATETGGRCDRCRVDAPGAELEADMIFRDGKSRRSERGKRRRGARVRRDPLAGRERRTEVEKEGDLGKMVRRERGGCWPFKSKRVVVVVWTRLPVGRAWEGSGEGGQDGEEDGFGECHGAFGSRGS